MYLVTRLIVSLNAMIWMLSCDLTDLSFGDGLYLRKEDCMHLPSADSTWKFYVLGRSFIY